MTHFEKLIKERRYREGGAAWLVVGHIDDDFFHAQRAALPHSVSLYWRNVVVEGRNIAERTKDAIHASDIS